MHRTAAILNPIAGRGAGAHLRTSVEQRLRQSGLNFELFTTEAPRHAASLARDVALAGTNTIVAVGGDGTFNEVLNGLHQAEGRAGDVAVGVMPIGTGNDFAFGAGIPLNPWQALEVIMRGETRVLDAGRIQADDEEPLFFGNGVGMGFDAMVNIQSRKMKRLRGFPLYLVAVLKTLLIYYSAPQTTVRTSTQEIEQPCLMVSIMNGQRVGGGFYVAPEARMDDGQFDLCVAAGMNRLRMLGFVPQFMRGTHTKDRLITMARGRRVTVISDQPWQAHVDGEIYGLGARRFEIELLPRSLRLIC